jgi:hypothetical protein
MNQHATGPSLAALGVITAWVAGVHLALLLGGPDSLRVSLQPQTTRTQSFQTRSMAPPETRPAPVQRIQPPRAPSQPDTALPTRPTELAVATQALPAVSDAVAPMDSESQSQVLTPTPAPQLEPLPPVTPAPMAFTVGALPPSTRISYKLTGQERGLTYYASGELRWQHNPTNYAASLTIKAFLIGSRVFSSVGTVGPQGLMPVRHGDQWRGEKATHFDAENHRINFSNNKPSVDLQPGAQDQVSLYVQLAAAMAGDPERYKPGSSVSIQTATINDAVPWTLTLQAEETVQVDGKPVLTTKWVCLPRGKYDTQVELWLSREQAWMPVRIRITQVSGSFIDMAMESNQALAPLASAPAVN